jgi:hypothetical protein
MAKARKSLLNSTHNFPASNFLFYSSNSTLYLMRAEFSFTFCGSVLVSVLLHSGTFPRARAAVRKDLCCCSSNQCSSQHPQFKADFVFLILIEL